MAGSYEIDFGPWGSIFPVPCAVADRHLKLCSEKQLKVLLLALRDGGRPVDLEAIAQRLGLTAEVAADCLDYWREAGLFAPAQTQAPAQAGDNPPSPAPPGRGGP